MDSSFSRLLPFFDAARLAGQDLVLATAVATSGSTYRKAGAQILISGDGRYSGMLSGGCLEHDLALHARRVLDSGRGELVTYELGGPGDELWGMGLGCEGGMRILLSPLHAAGGWQPLAELARCWQDRQGMTACYIVASASPALPIGRIITSLTDVPIAFRDLVGPWLEHTSDIALYRKTGDSALEAFTMPLALPARVLLLGAGFDAEPVVEFAQRVGFGVSVFDHRPALVQRARFPAAETMRHGEPAAAADMIAALKPRAAIVMSHHLASDRIYLQSLARSDVPFIGLLGPPGRRQRLLESLQPSDRARLGARLHAPVGLDLGGRTPETIALAIVAELVATITHWEAT
ncbi:MAG: XdhC family protein [Steroidobacteraceae bacterium]